VTRNILKSKVEFKNLNKEILELEKETCYTKIKEICIKMIGPSILFGSNCTFKMNINSHLKWDSNLNSRN
jgi:hypothetical protein